MDEPLIINIADAPAVRHPHRSTSIDFEPPGVEWPDTGINVQVMAPGQPNCKYHSEPVQEDFLVLHGQCIAIVDGEEKSCASGTSCTAPPAFRTCSSAPETGRARC